MKNTIGQLKPAALLALALAAPLVSCAQNLNGRWLAHLTVNNIPCTIETIMNAGNYSELVKCGPYMTYQSGTYFVSGNIITRNVIDWSPKQSYHVEGRPLGYDYRCPPGSYRTPDGHCPGWYGGPGHNYPAGPGGHYEPNAKPPGGSYQVRFNSANSMTWQDINFHGVVTFQRVR